MGKHKRWLRKLRLAPAIVNVVRKADIDTDTVVTLTWREPSFRNDLAERVAAEIRRSAIEPGKVACVFVDPDGGVCIADERSAKRVPDSSRRVRESVGEVMRNMDRASKALG